MTTALALPTKMSILLTERRDSIESALPKWIDADRFIITAMMALNRSWKLQNCTETSFYLSILESARSGLLPDGKEAVIIPYKDQAEFQPMAIGITRLMLRAEGVLKIEARCVHEGDYFDFAYGDEPYVKHKPEPGTDREVIAAYAVLWRVGTGPTPEITWRDDIDKAREQSRAPKGPHWTKWFSETCRKVPIKRLGKYIDLDSWGEHAIALDNAVTGDPSMVGSVYGPSEEYQSLLVKTQTIAGLEDLKERLNEENGDTKPPAEEEKKKEPAPDPEPEKPKRLENQWEPEIVKFLVDSEFVQGSNDTERRHRAVQILNHSPLMDIPFEKLEKVEAVAWVLGWEKIKIAHPRMKLENRQPKVLALWENKQEKSALIDLAIKNIPPD